MKWKSRTNPNRHKEGVMFWGIYKIVISFTANCAIMQCGMFSRIQSYANTKSERDSGLKGFRKNGSIIRKNIRNALSA